MAIAFASFFLFVFAVDSYNAVTYESHIHYIDKIVWEEDTYEYKTVTLVRESEQLELYYELDSEETLYHPYVDYDSGWEVAE